MPGIQDWRITPWATMDQMMSKRTFRADTIDADLESWEKEVDAFFGPRLSDPEAVRALPSLNSVPTHELVDGQLVRFRCMLQDMFDPEFYLASFEVKSLANGSVRMSKPSYFTIYHTRLLRMH